MPSAASAPTSYGSSYLQTPIVRRTAVMGIVGNLKTMQLEELLQWLSQSKKTGTLEINGARVEKRIIFRDGRIISSSSTNPEEYLGHFLVSHGFISEVDLEKAIRLQEQSGTLLGKILVTAGAIQEKDLHRLLRLKAEESIYDIFSWAEGDFRFLDDVLPEHTMVAMSLDVTAIVLEGVQRVDEWRRIRKVIPNGEAIPVAVAAIDGAKLDPGARQIVELVNDERTVGEIQLETHSSEYHVCRVLFDQVQQGRLKVIKPRWKRPRDTGEVLAAAAPAAVPGSGTVDATALLAAAQRYLERGEYDPALRHLRAARSLEPERKDIQDALRDGEKKIRQEVERAGVTLTAVPKLAASLETLTASKISPQEGFMLTRINGSYDIQSIVKITPMPQLDALLVFWKLSTAGHIRLEAPRAKG